MSSGDEAQPTQLGPARVTVRGDEVQHDARLNSGRCDAGQQDARVNNTECATQPGHAVQQLCAAQPGHTGATIRGGDAVQQDDRWAARPAQPGHARVMNEGDAVQHVGWAAKPGHAMEDIGDDAVTECVKMPASGTVARDDAKVELNTINHNITSSSTTIITQSGAIHPAVARYDKFRFNTMNVPILTQHNSGLNKAASAKVDRMSQGDARDENARMMPEDARDARGSMNDAGMSINARMGWNDVARLSLGARGGWEVDAKVNSGDMGDAVSGEVVQCIMMPVPVYVLQCQVMPGSLLGEVVQCSMKPE